MLFFPVLNLVVFCSDLPSSLVPVSAKAEFYHVYCSHEYGEKHTFK